MIKRLKYIFIPVLAILLMSHNTYATNTNVVPASVQVYYSVPGQSSVNSITLANMYTVSNSQDIKGWRIADGLNVNMLCYNLGTTIEKGSLFSFTLSAVNVAVGTIGGGPNIKPLSLSAVYMSNVENSINFRPTSYFITGMLNNDVNKLCLGDNNNVNSVLLFDDTYTATEIYFLQPKINFYDATDKSAEEIEEWRQEQQQSVNNISNQDSSDISNSENAATTNLVGALRGFFTTIANVPASNCLINGDLGNLDIGGINLCQGKENFNTLVEFIGFTALFGVVFWASYHLIKKTLALIDWARSK